VNNPSIFEKMEPMKKVQPFSKLLPLIFLFVVSSVFVPLAGPGFLFLLPMILFINKMFNGLFKPSAVFFISLAFLMGIAAWSKLDVPSMAVFTMGTAGILMAQIAIKNDSVEKTIVFPALLLIAAIGFYFIYDAVALSVSPWQLVRNFVTAVVMENVNLYAALPLKAEDIRFIKDNQQNIINGLVQIFPSIVVILSLMIIWANLLLGRNYVSRAGVIFPNLVLLARWKMPEKMIWIFILSGALLFAPEKRINILSLNVFLVMCFLYLLQGLAIVSYLFQFKNVPVFLRYLFYFFIAVQQFLMIPIIAIGLFDIWVDFRKIIRKDKASN